MVWLCLMWFECLLWIFIEAAPVRIRKVQKRGRISHQLRGRPIKTVIQTIQCSFGYTQVKFFLHANGKSPYYNIEVTDWHCEGNFSQCQIQLENKLMFFFLSFYSVGFVLKQSCPSRLIMLSNFDDDIIEYPILLCYVLFTI